MKLLIMNGESLSLPCLHLSLALGKLGHQDAEVGVPCCSSNNTLQEPDAVGDDAENPSAFLTFAAWSQALAKKSNPVTVVVAFALMSRSCGEDFSIKLMADVFVML